MKGSNVLEVYPHPWHVNALFSWPTNIFANRRQRRQVIAPIGETICSRRPPLEVQCESKKFPLRGPGIFSFFHKRLRIFNRFFTHLLYVAIYASLQIFIHLSPILTKLCHIKHDYPVHIICSKCPPSAKTYAFRCLRKSLIAWLIVVCGKSL